MQNCLWKMAWAATALVMFVLIGMAQVAIAQAVCDRASADVADRVENAPFSAQRRVITVTRNADGTSRRQEATQTEARDGKGRTYSAGERYWTTLIGMERVQKSETLVRIHDPIANTSTNLEFRVERGEGGSLASRHRRR